jgi:hypothetical protein
VKTRLKNITEQYLTKVCYRHQAETKDQEITADFIQPITQFIDKNQ